MPMPEDNLVQRDRIQTCGNVRINRFLKSLYNYIPDSISRQVLDQVLQSHCHINVLGALGDKCSTVANMGKKNGPFSLKAPKAIA